MREPDAAGTGWSAFLPIVHSFVSTFQFIFDVPSHGSLQILYLNVNFIILTGQVTEIICQIVQWHIQAKCEINVPKIESF